MSPEVMVATTIRLRENVKGRMERQAARERRSLASAVEEACEAWLAAKEES